MLRFTKPLISVVMILAGLYLAAFGNAWGPRVFELLPDSEIGSWLELIVPFLPMLLIGPGAALLVWHRPSHDV